MTKETLQALAEELAQKRGNPNEAARCKAILNEICAYEMSMFKQGANGKAYFPLLGEFNGQLDFNVAWDRFTECLLGLLKTYDPNAVSKRGRTSTFASSLANRLRWRIINFLRDNKSADYEDSPDALDSMAITDEYFEPSVTDFDVYIHVAEIIARVKAAEQNYSKSKRSYFEGFFTFDTTKLAKGKVFERDEYLGANDAIFPSLEAV
ncbi:MAG: hypothetical protein LBC41_00495, partial [Clostridiales bacterium]|nr:hypothetical protein [Clostridiales bacterium]